MVLNIEGMGARLKVRQTHKYLRKYKIISLLTIILLLVQLAVYPVFPANKGYAEDNEMTISSDYALTEDAEVNSLSVDSGTLNLNGHTLTIDGDFNQTGGIVDVNGGTLNITGDMNQSGGKLAPDKGKITVGGSYDLFEDGYLVMLNDNDNFVVNNDFTVANDNYSYESNNLKAGTIEVKGDFTQEEGSYNHNFVPSGTNKVILSGTNQQTISFEDTDYSKFNILKLAKPLPVGYIFNSEVKWNQLDEQGVSPNGQKGGDVTLSSDWKLPYNIEVSSLTIDSGSLDLNGHTLTVDGDVEQTGGTITLNSGALKISGDMNQSGGTLNTNNGKVNLTGSYSLTDDGNLVMINSNEYFTVGSNFTVANNNYSYESNNLQAGTIEIKGDFTQEDGSYNNNFVPSGTHKVILSGTVKQTISFESPTNNYFNILQVPKSLLTGYNFATKVTWKKLIQVSQNVPVTSVSLEQSDLTFDVGDSPVTLQATIAPNNATNKKVSFSSSDTDVAKVDANGVVTPVGEGTATITVKTSDGNKTDSCSVTVTPSKVAVAGVKLNTNSLSMNVGDTPVKLQATISPSNATDQNVSWSSSDKTVAIVDKNGTVSPIGPGSAVITVATEDGPLTTTCSVTVKDNSSYTLDDLVSDSDLFNDILGKYTIDQIHITLPATYIQEIKVTRNDAISISTFTIQVDDNTVDRVDIVAGGKTYPLTDKGDGVFTRSINKLAKGSEFVVKSYDSDDKKVDESVQRLLPMDYTANIPKQTDYTLEKLVDDTDLFNSLLDSYTLDQLKVVLPIEYINDAQTTYSSITTKFTVSATSAISKVTIDIKGTTYALSNKGGGKFERAIAGLDRGTTYKVNVYTLDGQLAEQKPYRVK
jgi:uncharacterized protein YjdB